MPRRSSGATTISSARTRSAIFSRLPDVTMMRLPGSLRQPLIDGAETVLMHEGQIILQMRPWLRRICSRSQARFPAPMTSSCERNSECRRSRKNNGAGIDRTHGEAGEGSHAQGDGNIPAQYGRYKARRRDGKRSHQRDAPERLVQLRNALPPVQAQRVQRSQMHSANIAAWRYRSRSLRHSAPAGSSRASRTRPEARRSKTRQNRQSCRGHSGNWMCERMPCAASARQLCGNAVNSR